MIEIPNPPPPKPCYGCGRSTMWLYSARRGQWVEFAAVGDGVLKPHECRDRRATSWRSMPKRPPAAVAAGVAKARAAIAERGVDDGDQG